VTLGRTGYAQDETPEPDGPLIQNGNGDGMDTHLFRPSVDSRGYFAVNGADMQAKNDFCFSLVLDYAHILMRTNRNWDERGADALINHSLQGTLQASYGIFPFLSAGIGLPFIVMSGGTVNGIGRSASTDNIYYPAALDTQKLAASRSSPRAACSREKVSGGRRRPSCREALPVGGCPGGPRSGIRGSGTGRGWSSNCGS